MAIFEAVIKSAAAFSKHLSFHNSITRSFPFKCSQRLVFPKYSLPYCTTSNPTTATATVSTVLQSNTEKRKTAAERLMEFFDEEKNWGQNDIRVGRAWKTDELRIKSNSDLHKLWFVLLKEKNMLLTMEHEYKHENEYFPNPERIDKIEESMKNLEIVVRERNEAYFKLETGETGERPGIKTKDAFGLDRFYLKQEHPIPSFMNKKWQEKNKKYGHEYACKKFRRLYFEKLINENRKARNRARNHVMGLIRRFPNMDMEAVKKDFPMVDLEYARSHHKARGHRENSY